jgi:hypothetical protein
MNREINNNAAIATKNHIKMSRATLNKPKPPSPANSHVKYYTIVKK